MAYEWITPVTDRDYYKDVYTVRSELAKKKQDISYEIGLLKGCLNYTDLNRIENNLHVLAEKLSLSIEESPVWSTLSVPEFSDHTRILSSAFVVRETFLTRFPEMEEETEKIPVILLNYADFNQLESLQLRIYEKLSESPSYDETKIAVVRLDENMQETDDVTYFDDFISARYFITDEANQSNSYGMIIGEKSGITETTGWEMNNIPNLKAVTIPETVKTIGAGTFSGSGLQIVTLHEGLKKIDYYAFKNCSFLEEIVIPSTVEEIYDQAFMDCTSLKNLTIQDGVKAIRKQAFRNCTALESLVIPGTVVNHGIKYEPQMGDYYGIFSACTSLKSVTIESGISMIYHNMFHGCTSLKNIILPDTVTQIGMYAFGNCPSLKEIILPETVTTLGTSSFRLCTSLEKIKLPQSLRKIYSYAFQDCEKLPAVVIPENARLLENDIFKGCINLTGIQAANAAYSITGDPWGAPNFVTTAQAEKSGVPEGKYVVEWDGTGGISDLEEKVLIKELNEDGTLKRYDTVKSAGHVKEFMQENPDTLFSVDIGKLCTGSELSPYYATVRAEDFAGLANLKNIFIPETFKYIEENAFAGCTGLDYIEIGKPKGAISGEPWGAPDGTVIYYSAELITENGDTLTGDGFFTVRTTGDNTTFNTGLSGMLRTETAPEEPVEKTLYILNEANAFSLKLGTKELNL